MKIKFVIKIPSGHYLCKNISFIDDIETIYPGTIEKAILFDREVDIMDFYTDYNKKNNALFKEISKTIIIERIHIYE